MGLVIPSPIKTFNRLLQVFKMYTSRDPKEGRQVIPLELDWDGSGETLDINVAPRVGQQPFSLIVTLDCDNSQCGADVTFIFPDTGDTLVIPAYSAGTFPVFTNSLQFYASAPAALASDITRVRVLNFEVAPVANPSPQFHNASTVTGIGLGSGTTALLAPAVNGTLVGYSVSFGAIGGAAAAQETITLIDTAKGVQIDGWFVDVPTGAAANAFFPISGIAYRFAGGIGLTVVQAGTAPASGAIVASLKYRSP